MLLNEIPYRRRLLRHRQAVKPDNARVRQAKRKHELAEILVLREEDATISVRRGENRLVRRLGVAITRA